MAQGTIIFDYDGTLHDTMRIYGPALRQAFAWLEREGQLEPCEYSDEWISHWLGWTTRDMWTTFAPQLPEEIWQQAASMVGQEMDRLSESGYGALFDGVPQMLEQLKNEGYTLTFLSNCRHAYRDAHRRYFGLDRWFDIYHCAEDYPGVPKWEIYRRAIDNERHPCPRVMVGDRFHDIEVATNNKIGSIGCRYGFSTPGELDAANICVDSPLQIPGAVKELVLCTTTRS